MMNGREFKIFYKLRFGLLSSALVLGLVFPPPLFSEIYKYVDQDGVVHLSNVPDARHNLVLREGWVRFRLGANFEQYEPLILKAAEKYRADYALVKAVIKAESNFNPSAVSRKGARGIPLKCFWMILKIRKGMWNRDPRVYPA